MLAWHNPDTLRYKCVIKSIRSLMAYIKTLGATKKYGFVMALWVATLHQCSPNTILRFSNRSPVNVRSSIKFCREYFHTPDIVLYKFDCTECHWWAVRKFQIFSQLHELIVTTLTRSINWTMSLNKKIYTHLQEIDPIQNPGPFLTDCTLLYSY